MAWHHYEVVISIGDTFLVVAKDLGSCESVGIGWLVGWLFIKGIKGIKGWYAFNLYNVQHTIKSNQMK